MVMESRAFSGSDESQSASVTPKHTLLQSEMWLRHGFSGAKKLLRSGMRRVRRAARKALNAPRLIHLIGWHGNDASGDDLLELCVKRLLTESAKKMNVPIEFTEDVDPDLFVVGGGTLLGCDSMGIYHRVARSRAPLVFFGGGFRLEHPLSSGEREQLHLLAARASLRGTRGYFSQQLLIRHGVDSFRVIGDPALVFTPHLTESLSGGFKVGVVVRSMGRTGEPQYTSNDETSRTIAEICDFLAEECDACFYFLDFAENPQDSDREGAENTITRMKAQHAIAGLRPMPDDPCTAFSVIGQLDYVVSQRLHPTIVAWLLKKPSIALDYQFSKTTDFMSSIGMNDLVVRTDEFSIDLYKRKFRRLMASRDTLINDSELSILHWQSELRSFADETIKLIR